MTSSACSYEREPSRAKARLIHHDLDVLVSSRIFDGDVTSPLHRPRRPGHWRRVRNEDE